MLLRFSAFLGIAGGNKRVDEGLVFVEVFFLIPPLSISISSFSEAEHTLCIGSNFSGKMESSEKEAAALTSGLLLLVYIVSSCQYHLHKHNPSTNRAWQAIYEI
jgi:hypothetical protein